ncbi:hypothetical protein ACQ4M3_12945 [Leptolyngbya sp. AN03gr2]|uniref:hypothetical protein n=1 Tax=unclassified Leptolyngbya TaxID=2650499 RepID=UPI003D310258
MRLDEFLNLSEVQREEWLKQASAEEREFLNVELAERLKAQGTTEAVEIDNHQSALLNFSDLGFDQEIDMQLAEIVAKGKMDTGFYRDSTNRLTHTLRYLDAVPEILQRIAPINYRDIPDYSQKLTHTSSEQQQIDNKIMSIDEEVNDVQQFTETERKLAEIWRYALSLSIERYQSLTQESDFWDLAGWCATIPYTLLKNQLESEFGIVLDESIEDHSTLREQATWLDFRVEYHAVFRFLNDWITTSYSNRTETTVKEQKLDLLPVSSRTAFRDAILHSKYHTVVIEDIQLAQLQGSDLVSARVRATGYLPSTSALAKTEPLELGFMLELTDPQEPRIVSIDY